MNRVIALVDMDCFYVQVEQRYNRNLIGKPCAVVQYNEWRGGGIIAVNYEARDLGVSRFIRGDDAKKACPEIELVRVPEVNGKADLTKYRNAGKEVIEVISRFSKCIERASIDEAYIDLTEEVKEKIATNRMVTMGQLSATYVVGYHCAETDDKEADRQAGIQKWIDQLYKHEDETWMENERQLAAAAAIVEEIRAAIEATTGFRCSAGIAHNKMLSKLACGLHKPNRQTVLPQHSVPTLFKTLPLTKVRNLGGKLGKSLEDVLRCKTMADIARLSIEELRSHFGEKTGTWLYELGRGIDHEPIRLRQLAQSIGCSKNFPGKNALRTHKQVKNWLERLASEIEVRLITDRETNNRVAKSLTVHASLEGMNAGVSRSCGTISYNAHRIAESSYAALEKLNTSGNDITWVPPIVSLGMSATKFQNFDGSSTSFMQNFLKNGSVIEAAASSSNAPETTSNPGGYLSTDDPGFNKYSQDVKSEPSESTKHDKPIGFFTSKLLSNPLEVKTRMIDHVQDGRAEELVNDHVVLMGEIECQNAIHKPDTSNMINGIDLDILTSLPESIQHEIRNQLSVGQSKHGTVSVNTKTNALFPDTSRFDGHSCKENGQHLECGYLSTSGSGPVQSDLSTFTTEISSDDVSQNPDSVFCKKCNAHILVWDVLEHSDYHVAMDLQSTINKSPMPVATAPVQKFSRVKGVSAATKGKSKRKGKNVQKMDEVKKVRSISSFFMGSTKGND